MNDPVYVAQVEWRNKEMNLRARLREHGGGLSTMQAMARELFYLRGGCIGLLLVLTAMSLKYWHIL